MIHNLGHKPLPNNLVTHKLKGLVKKLGEEPDRFDISQLVDSKLSFEENRKNVLSKFGLWGKYNDNQLFEDPNYEALSAEEDERLKEGYLDQAGEDTLHRIKLLDEWNKSVELEKYASIKTLNEKLGYKILENYKGSKTVGINNIFEIETVKEMLNIMSKEFKETQKRDGLIMGYGLYNLENLLELYNISELLDLKISIDIYFTDPRRKYVQKFNIDDNILSGGKKDRLYLHVSEEHKDIIDQISEKYSLSASTIGRTCLVHAFNSFYKDDESIYKLASAHYYIADNGMLKDIIEQLKAYRAALFVYFRRILRVLEEEYDKTLLDSKTNKERLAAMKDTIVKIKEMLKLNQFLGLYEVPMTKEQMEAGPTLFDF